MKSIKKRKPGVSGILRVKNDAEFLEECIESCISCLDELIIVYNDCTDNSPQLIEKKREQYPDKIFVYEYKPFLYNGSLTANEYEIARRLPSNSEHLLANYYNFALKKTTHEFVVKIDADQIYYTYRFKELCDCYRYNKVIQLKFNDLFFYTIGRIFFSTAARFKFKLPLINSKTIYNKFYHSVLNIIRRNKIAVSLSGLNILIDYNNNHYVSLGKKDDNIYILPPFNGVGDHIIFKITNETYFVPIEDRFYNKINGRKFSIIETLIGVKKIIPIGFLWIHLNSNRIKIHDENIKKLKIYKNSFCTLSNFISKFNYYCKWNEAYDPSIKSYYLYISFLKYSINNQFLKFFEKYYFDKNKFLRKFK